MSLLDKALSTVGLGGARTASGVRSAHVDTFVLDRLPPPEARPEFVNLDRLGYPERLNVATELVDAHVAAGDGDRTALVAGETGERWSYAELARRIDRIAGALTGPLGMRTGERVLLRSANTPAFVAAYFAVLKAGGVAVPTMPLLRAGEIAKVVEKAQARLALCDARFSEEMEGAKAKSSLERVVSWSPEETGELDRLAAEAPERFEACDTAADDPCLLGFTSGTTGVPKATIHYHRDFLAICDCYAKHVLRAEPDDVFIGSPPLAFTFGLGGLVLFPFRVGASAVLLEKAAPPALAEAVGRHRATVCFTAPTAYRVMAQEEGADLSSLRKCVSAGEALPRPIFDEWRARTGLKLMDGIGATEMLHIFIAAREEEIRPGATGKPVPLYEARVVDAEGRDVPDGEPGLLAVRGPTGCRYLDDPRQAEYARRGWNVTGDTYVRDADGYFWHQARSDDMIVSAGYNIAGPEVEAALLEHPAVAECGVVGAPDPARGRVVKAYVVVAEGAEAGPALAEALQTHVKQALAPYKYPRRVVFVDALPKTATGKLQRHALRARAEEEAR